MYVAGGQEARSDDFVTILVAAYSPLTCTLPSRTRTGKVRTSS
jgi:hypothetical protein